MLWSGWPQLRVFCLVSVFVFDRKCFKHTFFFLFFFSHVLNSRRSKWGKELNCNVLVNHTDPEAGRGPKKWYGPVLFCQEDLTGEVGENQKGQVMFLWLHSVLVVNPYKHGQFYSCTLFSKISFLMLNSATRYSVKMYTSVSFGFFFFANTLWLH